MSASKANYIAKIAELKERVYELEHTLTGIATLAEGPHLETEEWSRDDLLDLLSKIERDAKNASRGCW